MPVHKTSLYIAVSVCVEDLFAGRQDQSGTQVHFLFDPESMPKQSWDAFIMLLFLYTAFAVPYMLAFGHVPSRVPPTPPS